MTEPACCKRHLSIPLLRVAIDGGHVSPACHILAFSNRSRRRRSLGPYSTLRDTVNLESLAKRSEMSLICRGDFYEQKVRELCVSFRSEKKAQTCQKLEHSLQQRGVRSHEPAHAYLK